MALDHTPPADSGATDKRAELSKCNNHERQWFGGVNNTVKILAMQAEGLKLNGDATLEQINALANKVEEAKATYTTDWSAMAENMRANNRVTALQQATTKWNTVLTMVVEAAKAIDNVKQVRTGTKNKPGNTGTAGSGGSRSVVSNKSNTPTVPTAAAKTSSDTTGGGGEPTLMRTS